ncbi:MAG: hypothetical protein US49_C0007G0009 [candidate division TM6 bacterium GW2011_GWF2_37_49]|nr:MAG: hypothetical protein US49_C0007G0009 [candidate division TM6 bacterium GW2011_GWF2_37_49]
MKRFFRAMLLVIFVGLCGNANCMQIESQEGTIIRAVDEILMEQKAISAVRQAMQLSCSNYENVDEKDSRDLLVAQRIQLFQKIDALKRLILNIPLEEMKKISMEMQAKLEEVFPELF